MALDQITIKLRVDASQAIRALRSAMLLIYKVHGWRRFFMRGWWATLMGWKTKFIIPTARQNFVFLSGDADPIKADSSDRRFMAIDAVDVSRDRLSITIGEPSNAEVTGA